MASRIIKNIGFLSVSQAANYVLPLVTIPYITRVVGPENYGLVEFGTTVMLYFSAMVIYGFSFTATRKIASHPEQPKRVASIFATVLYTRLLLFIVVSALFILLLFSVPTFAENQQLLLYAFPVVLGWALYPEFLFQGLQKLSVIALANLAIKVLAAILIFVLLREKADYYLVVGINAFAQIVVALGTLFYAFKVLPKAPFPKPKFRLIKAYLRSGWYIFLSHFFTRIYTFGSIIFLGFLLTEKELGLFAAAMKLVIVGQSFLFTPLGGALFPYFANLYKQSTQAYRKAHAKFMRIMLLATVLASLIVALFPTFWVQLVFGEDYLSVAPYLQYMIPILAITTFSHFALKQGLMILRKDRLHLNVVIVVGLLSLLLNYVFITLFRIEGAVWAKISIEVLLAAFGWFYYQKAMRDTASSA
jgi:PST family polysaccharide transporter